MNDLSVEYRRLFNEPESEDGKQFLIQKVKEALLNSRNPMSGFYGYKNGMKPGGVAKPRDTTQEQREAGQKLLQENLGLVYFLAHKFRFQSVSHWRYLGIEEEDYMQLCFIDCFKACCFFDETKGGLSGYLTQTIRRRNWNIRNLSKDGRDVTLRLRKAAGSVGLYTLPEHVFMDWHSNHEDWVSSEEELERLLGFLSVKQLVVFAMWFIPMKYAVIGKVVGVSKERVRQLQEAACDRIRKVVKC